MTKPPFIYWIYFERMGKPERIYAKTVIEFTDILKRLIERTGEMPEWINRSYK